MDYQKIILKQDERYFTPTTKPTKRHNDTFSRKKNCSARAER